MTVDTALLQAEAADAAETQSIIADIVSGLPPEEDPVVALEPDGAPSPADPAPEVPAAEAAAPEAPAAKPPEPEDTRGLLRILEREGQVRDREAQIERREAALRAEEAKLRAAPRADHAEFRDRLMDDPMGLLREIGADPAYVARLVTAEVLGDKAPADLRASTETDRLRAQMTRKTRELERMIRERDHEAERARVRAEARDYAAAAREASAHPTVDRVAASDRDYVVDAIFEEIARDARDRAGTDRDDGRPLSPADAAARLEARWARVAGAATKASTGTGTAENAGTVPAETPRAAAPPPLTKNPPRTAKRRRAYYEAPDPDDAADMAHALDVLRGRVPA